MCVGYYYPCYVKRTLLFQRGHELCNYKASELQSSNLNPEFLALGQTSSWTNHPIFLIQHLGQVGRVGTLPVPEGPPATDADGSGEKRTRVEGEQENARQSSLPLHQSWVRSPKQISKTLAGAHGIKQESICQVPRWCLNFRWAWLSEETLGQQKSSLFGNLLVSVHLGFVETRLQRGHSSLAATCRESEAQCLPFLERGLLFSRGTQRTLSEPLPCAAQSHTPNQARQSFSSVGFFPSARSLPSGLTQPRLTTGLRAGLLGERDQ